MNLVKLSSLAFVGLLPVAACTVGGDSETVPDGAPVENPDARLPPDGGPVECHADPAGYTSTDPIPEANTQTQISDDGTITYLALLNEDQDQFQLELYPTFGVFAGTGVVPGTYEITGDELNYATCGLCVRFFADADQNGAASQYFATGGTVTITEVGAAGTRFKAELTGVTMETVTINPNTFLSTPVGDGCVTQLDVKTDSEITPAQ